MERHHVALVGGVSIRAPARGATSAIDRSSTSPTGFDPRSRTGSDKRRLAVAQRGDRFRSALPHGERRKPELDISAIFVVSIRAPARGATGCTRLRPWKITCFDPRSRTGSDHKRTASIPLALEFRSALPHGERRRFWISRPSTMEFRSALPHGERRSHAGTADGDQTFRSALPHGERRGAGIRLAADGDVSIRAPARGATCRQRRGRAPHRRFDPRSRTGSDA